ncbi:MAG: class II fructose-bisphosphate aldolase [Clostridiales bacterium]|jgi:fructose-bisphosphate aldolase class II|nr:class II fructose-bisphosphate aldolase [Clostridiales bacterium]
MLVTFNEVLRHAEENNCAAGAFNTPTLECLTAVISAAEELGAPVILSHAELHENAAPLSVIGPIMVLMAKRSKTRVCVLLDHCERLGYLKQTLEIGFTGVMYDGSALPYDENVANTKKAVEMAGSYGAGVEGEIGTLAPREGSLAENAGSAAAYTDPDLAQSFARETGIAALAPSFGSVHGLYREKPNFDFGLLKKIKAQTGLPLVMHGGSGCSDEDYRKLIACGIRKINYYSYMAFAGSRAARDCLNAKENVLYHDAAAAARNAMKEDAMRAMRVFAGENGHV